MVNPNSELKVFGLDNYPEPNAVWLYQRTLERAFSALKQLQASIYVSYTLIKANQSLLELAQLQTEPSGFVFELMRVVNNVLIGGLGAWNLKNLYTLIYKRNDVSTDTSQWSQQALQDLNERRYLSGVMMAVGNLLGVLLASFMATRTYYNYPESGFPPDFKTVYSLAVGSAVLDGTFFLLAFAKLISLSRHTPQTPTVTTPAEVLSPSARLFQMLVGFGGYQTPSL